MSSQSKRLTAALSIAIPTAILAAAILAAATLLPSPLLAEGAVASGPRFEEIGEQAGARLIHKTRSFGERHKAQVLEMFTDGGAAVAVGDYNNDGLDDLFVVDSDQGRPHRLLRNEGNWQFKEVAKQVGVSGGNDESSICADAMWLDYDNDGLLDLLVGRFGTPLLFRNEGPGKEGTGKEGTGKDGYRFTDVSEAVGLTAFGNTIGMITFDADADGWLDLLLGNYFQPVNLLELATRNVLPNNLDYADNGGGVTFWRNVAGEDGGRRFVEQTEAAGFSHHTGWTLDVGHADLDNDGDQDVYLAGDYGTDRLFINQGDGTFKDTTEEAMGFDTRKGMNVDMGDYDRDGFLDIYVTNITDEYMKECNMLWQNQGDGTFIDLSRETGTCDTDWGWAAKFGDFDNDGWEDLFAVNGLRSRGEANYIPQLLEVIITPNIDFSDVNSYPDIGEMTWSGYQKQRFFHNLGDGTFKEIAAAAGVDNDLDGRGIGMADFDNDGLLDLYQTNASQPTLLYRNRTENAGHWLAIRLVGKQANRQGIGARVEVRARAGDGPAETFLREVNGGNAYSSQSSTQLHFGLGANQTLESIKIRWPHGLMQEMLPSQKQPIAVDQVLVIREGEGIVQ